MKVKEGKSVNYLFRNINLSITRLIESSRRDLFIDMVVQKFIFKNNLITLLSRFTFHTRNRYRNTQNRNYYFHINGSVGIVKKIEFDIRPDLGCTVQPSKRREKWIWTTRLRVCVPVLLFFTVRLPILLHINQYGLVTSTILPT